MLWDCVLRNGLICAGGERHMMQSHHALVIDKSQNQWGSVT